MQNYHRLFWANQERSDRMSHLSNSTSDYSLRADLGSDGSDGVQDVVEGHKESPPKENNQNGDAGQVDCISSPVRPHLDSNSSSNEDSRESPTGNNEQNVSPNSGKSESGLPFGVPRPPDRGRTPRRQLMLDFSNIGKAKFAFPGVLSPTETVSPKSTDPLKRRTQSRYNHLNINSLTG